MALCVSGDDALKFELLMNAAQRFEKDLGDRREAIECLREALVVRPGDGDVLRRVDALFTQERMWPELLENLKLQMATAVDEAARRALAKRIAGLYASELNDPMAALHTYRDVLASDCDADSVAALLAIGESHDDLRAEAAQTLEPVLRAAGRYPELAAALELRLRAESEPTDRSRTLRSLAEVARPSSGIRRVRSRPSCGRLSRTLRIPPFTRKSVASRSELDLRGGRSTPPRWTSERATPSTQTWPGSSSCGSAR